MHFDENMIIKNYEQFEIFELFLLIYLKTFELFEMEVFFLQKIKVYMKK
jgi:hypothetical protein